MNKISFSQVQLNCYLQRATEINTNECHQGVISKDSSGLFRFEERVTPERGWDRNPKIYEGQIINITCQRDGRMKLNFKLLNTDAPGFKPSDFAYGVYAELTDAFHLLTL